MLSEDMKLKIFADERIQKVPLVYQAIVLNVIEEILDDDTTTDSETY